VVTGVIPDYCVAVGSPARVIKQYAEGQGWLPKNEFVSD
jgi:acetyltransferase-like isoleucine patch superfamily enzyme